MEIIEGISGAIALAKQLLALPGLAKNAEARLLLADLQARIVPIR